MVVGSDMALRRGSLHGVVGGDEVTGLREEDAERLLGRVGHGGVLECDLPLPAFLAIHQICLVELDGLPGRVEFAGFDQRGIALIGAAGDHGLRDGLVALEVATAALNGQGVRDGDVVG